MLAAAGGCITGHAACPHHLICKQEPEAGTDGSGWLQLEGRASRFHGFLIVGKEDWGHGAGGNPVMQLAAHYAKSLEENWDTSVVTNTVFPAVGVEVFGHGMR